MGVGVPEAVQATAYLAAACRAAETRHATPRLRDDLAELFVRARPPDQPAYRALLAAGGDEVVARTVLLDDLLERSVAGDDPPTVVNLGAGFCTRPYRLDLSGCPLVIECDTDAVIAVKSRVLAGHRPRCPVRRVAMDLRDPRLGRHLTRLGVADRRLVVVSEGLLPYLSPAATGELAGVLAAVFPRARWLTDLVSAESAQGMTHLARATGAPVQVHGLSDLAPFERSGWTVADYRILPAPRRGPVPRLPGGRSGRTSHRVVDGVVALHRPPHS